MLLKVYYLNYYLPYHGVFLHVYEQLIITLYIEMHSEQSSLTDTLHRYNEDYSYQHFQKLYTQLANMTQTRIQKMRSLITAPLPGRSLRESA